MKETIKVFWRNLLERLNSTINQYLNKDSAGNIEVRADDCTIVNFFAMILKKVLNHVFTECDFSVTTDSTAAEPLIELAENLQRNCYKIGAYMLGGSDTPQNISECWVVPALETINGRTALYHTFLDGSRVRITRMTADRISECYMVVDIVRRNHKTYLLCRKHELDTGGDLTISYFIADEQARAVSVDIPEWQTIVQNSVTYRGANHIGFGRYKSPVVALGGNDTYGKPLNYGCGVIEAQIQTVIKQIQLEFKASGKKLFPDWSIVRREDKDGNPLGMYCIDEYIYPVKHLSGQSGNLIDEFSPQIRESSYYMHLNELLKQYEALCGLNNMLTKSATSNATATEIRALSIDNISLENNVRQAIRDGNIMTLEADSIYLGIRPDLWSYDETWTDIYEDEQQRLNNMLLLYENGAVEQIDLIKYWFPTLADDEAQEKLERINATRQSGGTTGLESVLNM